MGAWSYLLQRFTPDWSGIQLELASRPFYSVPAAGSSARFKERQQKVIDKIFSHLPSSEEKTKS